MNKFNNAGVYKLKCKACPLQYIGQTGRTFQTRYKEHIWAIRNNQNTSRYAKHILDTGQSYGKKKLNYRNNKHGKKRKIFGHP
jgi:hypothetical protein